MAPEGPPPSSDVAPLLKQLIAEYAASGLPPAYVPLPVLGWLIEPARFAIERPRPARR